MFRSDIRDFIWLLTWGAIITCLLAGLLALPVVGLSWLASSKQAATYNRLCKPVTPVTTSDVFWMGRQLSTTSCNLPIKLEVLK